MIAGHRTFAADFAFFCHDKTPYIEKQSLIICMKTGYIHVLQIEGKLFLKCSIALVLTLMDDYVKKICFNFAAIRPPFINREVSFEDPSVPGEL